jgi:drug/metabolite transporter (DMT)-like permease
MSEEPSGHENGNTNANRSRHGGSLSGSFTGHDESRSHESDHLSASNTQSPDGEYRKSTSSYLKSPYWWLGQILITLGEMGNFLAYGFAPASIVSPLGVVALVSNCIIAPVMFHERFRARDFWGVIIAVGGVVTVVFSANQEETKLEPHDVWDAITTMEFEIYLGVTVSLIVLLMWASSKYGRRTILIDLGLVGLFGLYRFLSLRCLNVCTDC